MDKISKEQEQGEIISKNVKEGETKLVFIWYSKIRNKKATCRFLEGSIRKHVPQEAQPRVATCLPYEDTNA